MADTPVATCLICGWNGRRRVCAACGAALWSPDDDARGDGAGECTVVLSFDVDGASGMINRNPAIEHLPSARSFGDYGPAVAVPHVLTLLARHNLASSFYIPGWVAERVPAVVERIAAAGHEIGHHGYQHEPPATLNAEQEAEVLDRGSDILAGIVGTAPVGYRSPSWELSADSLRLMRERGFRYDSSLMGADAPYWVEAGNGESLVELPIHWAVGRLPLLRLRPYRRPPVDGRTRAGRVGLARGLRRGPPPWWRVHADNASLHHRTAGAFANARPIDRSYALKVRGDVRARGGRMR